MNKVIGILLIGLLGFSGCSSSEAEDTTEYNVQAVGLVDGYGLSVTAYVMDQEENLSSDAMLTIDDNPMDIGFSAAEDLNMDQNDSLSDGMDQTVTGGPSGDYQPYYFLNLVDVNERDTVNFVAKGRHGNTLYSTSAVVPELITIIEPTGDDTLPASESVVVRWEGGAPCSQFRVSYYRGSDAELFSSGTLQGSTEFIMPQHWIDEGWGVIFVDGCYSVDEDDQKEKESSIGIRVEADLYIEMGDGTPTMASLNAPCVCGKCPCSNYYNAKYKWCTEHPHSCPRMMRVRILSRFAGCRAGCGCCPT